MLNLVVGGERVRVEAGGGASNFEADPGRLVIVFKVEREYQCLDAAAKVERE